MILPYLAVGVSRAFARSVFASATTQGVSFFIAVTNLTELGEASWGYNTEITPAGGEYRLCWCSAQFQCNEAHDFRVDFGALTVIGPQPLAQQ